MLYSFSYSKLHLVIESINAESSSWKLTRCYPPTGISLALRLLQRLDSIAGGVTAVWKTILYMSYATVQKHMAFKEML